jgi:hypothetical protein
MTASCSLNPGTVLRHTQQIWGTEASPSEEVFAADMNIYRSLPVDRSLHILVDPLVNI